MLLISATLPALVEDRIIMEFPPASPDRRPPSSKACCQSGPVRACLSLARAGSMRFLRGQANAARHDFLRGIGLRPEQVLGLELTHSRRVLFVRDKQEFAAMAEPAYATGGADGLVLRDADDLPRDERLAASVTVADCMPIWLLDRGSGAFGVLHSGWQGTGILKAAVLGLAQKHGCDPSDLSLILGPSIGPCCYDVPAERARAFASEFGEEAVSVIEGRPRLDLRRANIKLARELGVGSLLSVEACTMCDGRLGSYRRQGPTDFTRMIALCGRFEGPTSALQGL